MEAETTSQTQRPRVLIIAEAANPALTSVALIGWSLSSALMKIADVHVVTESRNADEIAKGGWAPNSYTIIDNQEYQNAAFRIANKLRGGKSLGWTIYSAFANIAYPKFEQAVWRKFESALRAGEYDLVHRITPLSPTSPSPLATHCKKIGVPYIAGPLNGGLPWPSGYGKVRRQEREWLSYVRTMYKFQPAVRRVYRDATAIIAASTYTREDIPCSDQSKIYYLPENAIDEARFPRQPFKPATPRLRIAFVGRLVPYKGADVVLRAASEMIRAGTARIDIIGDGPQLPELETIIRAEGLEDGVTLHGWVEHTAVNDLLAECQIFAFPSIREFGGGVVLESMAKGLMPLIAGYGGPSELVPEGTGIQIPLGAPEELARDMATWLQEFHENLDKLDAFRTAAQDYVYANFTWTAKAEQIMQIYAYTLGWSDERPQFTSPLNAPATRTNA